MFYLPSHRKLKCLTGRLGPIVALTQTSSCHVGHGTHGLHGTCFDIVMLQKIAVGCMPMPMVFRSTAGVEKQPKMARNIYIRRMVLTDHQENFSLLSARLSNATSSFQYAFSGPSLFAGTRCIRRHPL